MEVISKKEAKALGLKRYFLNRACGRGHIAERWVSNGVCVECNRLVGAEKTRKWNAANPEYGRKYRAANRERIREQTNKWRAANPEKHRAHSRKSRANNPETWREYNRKHRVTQRGQDREKLYGISPREWDVMFAAQGNACAICKTTEPGKRHWHTDHCHDTGIVRGILCTKCNVGIGLLDDRADRLRAATKYLECSGRRTTAPSRPFIWDILKARQANTKIAA